MDHGPAFPPARIIIVRSHLVEPEFLIVVRPDPFGGVDGTFFQRRIDVAAGKLLRHAPELLQHPAGVTADAHLESVEVRGLLDFLAEPAPHLRAGVAGGERIDVVFLVEFVGQIETAPEIRPGVLLA